MNLTVAICTYKRFQWLKICLNALKKQTLPVGKFTIIVVDNSLSMDESIPFRDSLSGFNNLDYIITEKSGLSYARNIAINKCLSPIISFLDDDTIAEPDWAENVLKAFNRYPAAGVIGGKVSPVWEEPPPEWLQGTLLYPLAVVDWGKNDSFVDHKNNWVVGANISYRTELLRKFGGFNTSLGRKQTLLLAHEEMATNLSIQAKGYDVVYVPSIKVNHLIQAERTTKEWLTTNSVWEGASRTVYEYNTEITNTDKLADSITSKIIELQKNHLLPDTTEEIQRMLNLFKHEGKNICIECIGKKDISQKQDYRFDNITSVIYIVTPCLNSADTLDQTILSILSQAGNFSIRYHIQDGGSTDGSLKILSLWEERLSKGNFPVQCRNIVFTFDSSPDKGMYDAVAKGFASMAIPPNAFMSWLNADDILIPGTFSFVHKTARKFKPEEISWLNGASCIIKDNTRITQGFWPTPTEALREGLCDGEHWNFIQQEGTFFRNWLWEKTNAKSHITEFKYAGDWYLWRLLANHVDLVQFEFPLAAFRIRDNQLSQKHFNRYMDEIKSKIPLRKRKNALKSLVQQGNLKSTVIKHTDYPSGDLIITEINVQDRGNYQYNKIFGKWPNKTYKGATLRKSSSYSEQQPPTESLSTLNTKKNDLIGKENHFNRKKHAIHSAHQKITQNNNNTNLDPKKFNNFTFSRCSHWKLFEKLDIELFGEKVDSMATRLKTYQDLLTLAFIKNKIPLGSKILDVGGGDSRILHHLSSTYECWNVDPLEGLGNGPRDTKNIPGRLVRDYMGNFNSELPNNYFDFVFSISALEHVPENNPAFFDKIIDDINRVLKPGCYSLHLMDIVIKPENIWFNKIINRMFERLKTCNAFIDPEEIVNDPDLYYMSEIAYNNSWMSHSNLTYSEFGRPVSYNILWQKEPIIVPLIKQPEKNTSRTKKTARAQTIHIVTPCLNSENTIDQTIKSIFTQNGDFNIQYHIQDGGSTDGTVDKLKWWSKTLKRKPDIMKCNCIDFTWSSEPDEGMYDGIVKGFSQLSIYPDNFMAWINADDILLPGALTTICTIANNMPKVQWIGGAKHVFNNNGVQYENLVPFPRELIKNGLCDGIHWNYLQQEGIFFRKKLWFKSKHALNGFKLAGDWNLWRTMAHHVDYYQYEMPLGGFRQREGQLSAVKSSEYENEINNVIEPGIRKNSFECLCKEKNSFYNLISHSDKPNKAILKKKSVSILEEHEKRINSGA